MKELKGTKTEINLLTAFAGESQARNRYAYFASEAKKEGYEQISAIFLETADNEKEHAKRLFKFLKGGEVKITAAFPAGIIGKTAENLQEKRYLALLENIEKGRVFKRAKPIKWKCRNCGYIHEGTSAPEICPACEHPQAYYELLDENW